jgi:peptidoglycan hydrolase-like protein with peptidoglycan-binding domain
MKSASFTILTLLVIAALGAGGYFAITSLKDPGSYIPKNSAKIGDLHQLQTEPESTVVTPNPAPVVVTTPEPVQNSLQANIQSLIDKKVTLKVGSRGVNVGYIQTFMNAYFNKTLKVDNDFGKTLEGNVKAFQKASGVTQTGQIGPTTLSKMIDWLDKNPQ